MQGVPGVGCGAGAWPRLLRVAPSLTARSVARRAGVTGQARAYIAIPPPHVVICVNNLRSSSEIEEALVHELVHLYDVR